MKQGEPKVRPLIKIFGEEENLDQLENFPLKRTIFIKLIGSFLVFFLSQKTIIGPSFNVKDGAINLTAVERLRDISSHKGTFLENAFSGAVRGRDWNKDGGQKFLSWRENRKMIGRFLLVLFCHRLKVRLRN